MQTGSNENVLDGILSYIYSKVVGKVILIVFDETVYADYNELIIRH